MDAKSVFRETFDKAKRPLSERETRAAKAVRKFVARANENDDLEIAISQFGTNAGRVTLSVAVDGGEAQHVMVRLQYNAPMSDRVLASPITDGESFLDDKKGTFYDLNQPDHHDLLLTELVRAAATEAAKADHTARFRKAIATP